MMQSNKRQSLRLPYYDYSQRGIYFITICIRDRQCILAEIFEGSLRLNDMGAMMGRCWHDIPNHFPHMTLDAYVIMPNHIHGIIIIEESIKKDECYSPLHGTSKTIGSAVRGFKIGVTQWVRKNTALHDIWQRNYYEHIIRNDVSLHQIKEYITHNPETWTQDKLHPSHAL